MLRYIALVWNPEVAEDNAVASRVSKRVEENLSGWTSTLDTSGLRVYHAGTNGGAQQVYPLHHKGGVVLGRLFRRDRTISSLAYENGFSKSESEALFRSRGGLLIERYWGSYVAILRESGRSNTLILRDPTGAVPCFITQFGGIHVVYSHVDDCDALQLIEGSVNWDHIAAYLWFDHLVTSETGLDDVRQVNAGERTEISSRGVTGDYCWFPDRFCRAPVSEDRQQAGRALRSTIESCVSAWASPFRSILLELSGGLDSSIVLSCLSRADSSPGIVCENHLSQNAESDERVFAREAANASCVELIEALIPSIDQSFDCLFNPMRLATPAHTVFVPETHSAKVRLVKSRGIEAIFSGQGGDHFFQRSKNPHIAAEFARRHGLGGELLHVIEDTSRFTAKPIWSVMATAVLFGLFRRPADPYDFVRPPTLASERTRDATNRKKIRHPWVDCASDLPGSKRQQIFHIIDSQVFRHMPEHNNAEVVHPLISQPIIELCLRIPSYVLTYNGIDRALVRDAFAGVVPANILARTTKGATTGYFINLLIRHVTVLREYLLGGLLVSEGVLDKCKTDDALSERSLVRDGSLLFPVLNAFRAEIWLRSWVSSDRRTGP